MKIFRLIAVVAAFFILFNYAQAGSSTTSTTMKDGQKITTKVQTDNQGTTTTVVTTRGKDGNVTTATTVTDKDGKIISTDDPQARAKADETANKKQENLAAIANAPKRGPNDPIQMVLFQTVVDETLRKTMTKEGVFPLLRKEFENDPVIKLLDQKRVDQYAKERDFKTGKFTAFSSFEHRPEYLPADVYIESFARIEDKVGISKASNKLASAPFLTYRAVIHSEFSDKTWEVKEEGHILTNIKVTKNFADKIRNVVLNEVGATIPADAGKYRRGTAGLTKGQADAAESLRNLFKKK